jgi:hypothetical protein
VYEKEIHMKFFKSIFPKATGGNGDSQQEEDFRNFCRSTDQRLSEITAVLRDIEDRNRRLLDLMSSWVMGRPFETDGRYQNPKSLARFNRKIYSQLGEDGIVSEIFGRIGRKSNVFVECGVGNGLENTTRFLLESGWKGYWFEGNPEDVRAARDIWKDYIADGRLHITEAFITADNINTLMSDAGVPPEVDYLSIDLDYITPHIWKALTLKARVACIESNPSLPPNVEMYVPYVADRLWDGSNWYGGSLKALELIGREKGMALVGCDLTGSDSFFVREAEALGKFIEPFDADTHYEPPRNYYPHGLHHPSPANPREWIRK